MVSERSTVVRGIFCGYICGLVNDKFISYFRPQMPESLAAMFSRKFSSFGFAAHLFQEEIRNMEAGRPASIPDSATRGSAHLLDSEIPAAHDAQWPNGSTFFLHLLCPSRSELSSEFDRSFVRDQIRELAILEGINIRYEHVTLMFQTK